MRLLLTSAGLTSKVVAEKFLNELRKPSVENRILLISLTRNIEEESYTAESAQELRNLGVSQIVVVDMKDVLNMERLGDFDVVYVCGGNTFSILNRMKETGLFDFVKKQVTQGALYVGVSAGSIIACLDIAIAGWGSEGDKNEIGLMDLAGLNFIDISVYPHYRPELRGEVESFQKTVQHKVYALTDEQALFVDGSEVAMVSE